MFIPAQQDSYGLTNRFNRALNDAPPHDTFTSTQNIPFSEPDFRYSDKGKKSHGKVLKWLGKCAVFLVRKLLPKRWSDNDTEGGSDLPKIVTAFMRWWGFYGTSLTYALMTSVFLFGLYTLVILPYLNRPPEIEHLDRQGLRILNVQETFEMYQDLDKWMEGQSVISKALSKFTEEELERGYFNTTIRGLTNSNVTIPILRDFMKKNCRSEKCRCISALHAGVIKNVAYINPDKGEDSGYFMIDPVIVDSKGTGIVAYQSLTATHEDLHKEGKWVKAPISVTVEYKNEENVILRKKLGGKGSTCLYKCLKWLDLENIQ